MNNLLSKEHYSYEIHISRKQWFAVKRRVCPHSIENYLIRTIPPPHLHKKILIPTSSMIFQRSQPPLWAEGLLKGESLNKIATVNGKIVLKDCKSLILLWHGLVRNRHTTRGLMAGLVSACKYLGQQKRL